MLFLRAAFSAS